MHWTREGLFLCHAVMPNWALALVLLTTLIRLLLFPLQVLSLREQAKLKALKPRLDRLQEMYKDDGRTLLRERSVLLREAGSRPWLALLTALVPLPIFISLYKTLSVSAELKAASLAWIPSLAATDPLFVLPLLAASLTWLQSRESRAANLSLAYLLPALSFFFLVTMPAGLALYSVTNSALQVLGQRVAERWI